MNFIDIIIVVLLIWSGYKGFRKGFIIEIASIFALLLGLWGGLNFSSFLTPYLQRWFSLNSEYTPLIAFSVIFVIILILVFLVAKLIEKLIKSVGLGLPNRLAGAVLGAAKTIIIISVLLMILNRYDVNGTLLKTETKQKSLLYKPLSELVIKVYPSALNIIGKTLQKKDEK